MKNNKLTKIPLEQLFNVGDIVGYGRWEKDYGVVIGIRARGDSAETTEHLLIFAPTREKPFIVDASYANKANIENIQPRLVRVLIASASDALKFSKEAEKYFNF